MKKIIRLTEKDLTRIVKRVIMEQTTTMVDDVKKFCQENGFTSNKDGNGFSKKTNKHSITIVIFQYPDKPDYNRVEFCVSNKNSINCEIFESSYTNKNWDYNNFSSTVKKYL
jgi:hypothetical protein